MIGSNLNQNDCSVFINECNINDVYSNKYGNGKDIMSNDVIKQAFDNNVNKISCIPETIETIGGI